MNFWDELKNAFKYNNAVMQLLAINLIIFLVEMTCNVFFFIADSDALYQLITNQLRVPANLTLLMYRPWSLFTYAFTHKDIWHILVNMLMLYFMGQIVREFLGNKRLIGLYVMAGLTGALAFIAIYNLVPRLHINLSNPMLALTGASGSVYGIAVAAAVLTPNAVVMLFGVFPMRLKFLVGAMVLLSFFEMASKNTGGNTAHLGGALMGFIFVTELRNGRDWGMWVNKIIDFFVMIYNKIFNRRSQPKFTYNKNEKIKVKPAVRVGNNNNDTGFEGASALPNQTEIDKILDKISEKGYESLSKDEKQRLFDASKR